MNDITIEEYGSPEAGRVLLMRVGGTAIAGATNGGLQEDYHWRVVASYGRTTHIRPLGCRSEDDARAWLYWLGELAQQSFSNTETENEE